MLSDEILSYILDYLSTKSTKELSQNFKHISDSYRHIDCKNVGLTKQDVDAYLVGRFPLTYAVIVTVLNKIKAHLQNELTVTDYGAGPATALLALCEVFDRDKIHYLGIEEKSAMQKAAIYLSSKLDYKIELKQMNVEKAEKFFSHLGIASYLLNELQNIDKFLDILLAHHEHILVIEPGTPDGYARILKVRDKALEKGFFVIAPCPHQKACPLSGKDWCHFYKRVERSKILKQIKGASLGYEDEKFSYIFLSKTKALVHDGVILDKPVVHPFKVDMKVCCKDGSLQQLEISKKDKDSYKAAKKMSWGDFI